MPTCDRYRIGGHDTRLLKRCGGDLAHDLPGGDNRGQEAVRSQRGADPMGCPGPALRPATHRSEKLECQ